MSSQECWKLEGAGRCLHVLEQEKELNFRSRRTSWCKREAGRDSNATAKMLSTLEIVRQEQHIVIPSPPLSV